jgi:cyclopropane fatty-acyl-phospholipid synthase-like methyltransferase
MPTKPYSQACENNKQPILEVIRPFLKNATDLLEIGSGTGQHAIYFAEKMPHINWQTSDLLENHQSIQMWLDDCPLNNIYPPIALNVLTDDWPEESYDAVFSANTAHIMPWHAVEAMFKGVANQLNSKGLFILYGPFKYNGEYTSASNEQFEGWLKSVDPERGIRDFEAIQLLANNNGMSLLNDYPMPANNQILVWQKTN